MLRINQLKLKIDHSEKELAEKILQELGIREDELLSWSIRKQSLDARKKPLLFSVYTVDCRIVEEQKVWKRLSKKKKNGNISLCTEKPYQFPEHGTQKLPHRPVVVGSGPAGLFCAWALASQGYAPVLLEQGAPVEQRQKDVARFWETGTLNPWSNVQFGEGGAGTFSDGKLNTLVKDPKGRIRKVMEVFVEHGAPKEILYLAKPHIGTDLLTEVVKNIREEICAMGGDVHFYTKMTDLRLETDSAGRKMLKGIHCRDVRTGESLEWDCSVLVLAPGHSARDTFYMLHEKGVPMEAKSFAVGVRVEHPQQMIDCSQYGEENAGRLPAAAYKLTGRTTQGRGVYSFCMCPGGYVVNASSEEGRLAVNGMSFYARDGKNANSAIIVTVGPEDFGGGNPLAGVDFQRELEEAAYREGLGKIPVQRLEDFREDRPSQEIPKETGWAPCMKGAYHPANLRNVFPVYLSEALLEGMEGFDRKIKGFSHPDTLLSGVESRTSSPVRIVRGDGLSSEVEGLYPCGEGAGYAGGITSAAMDGLKTAEQICAFYAPFDKGECC